MKAQSDLFSNLKFCSQGSGWFVILFGCVGLAGWTLAVEPFKNVLRGVPGMVPNTAIAFVLAGLSLQWQRNETAGRAARWAAKACALGVALCGALTLCEYLFGWEAGIDALLFREPLSKLETSIPGRPSFLTALNFLLLGLALLLLDVRSRYDDRPVELLTVTAILISLLALIGYACSVPSFYGWGSLFPGAGMALPTAAAFTVLGAGLFCARPERGLMRIVTSPTASGVMARRLLLAPVLIPLMTGLVKVAWLRKGMYNVELVSWLFALLNILIFTGAIWWSASLLYRAESVRLSAEADVRKLNVDLERRVHERTAEVSKAMTAVQESEERGRLVLDTALDAVVTIDGQGLVTSWNREAENTFGWTRQEIIGQSLSSTIIPPRYREAHQRGLKQFLATGEGPVLNKRIEIAALHRDGREFPVELAITPVRMDDHLTFSAFIRDISERARAEQAVARESQLLRTVIDHLPDYIYVKDTETRFLLVNAPSLRLMKLDRVEDTLGKTVFDFFPPDQARAFVEDDRRVIESGQPVLDREEPIIEQGGPTRYLLTTKLPLRDASGQVTGLVGISRDITERKQVEERLRQSEANLAAAQKMAHLGSWEMHLTDLEDVNRNPLHWSDEVFRIFGYAPGQIDISRENFLRMIHPDDRLRVSEAMPALLKEKRPYNLVHRISLADGIVRLVHELAEIAYDEATGRPLKVVGTVQDVTERKLTEEKAAWLASFPERSPNPIIELDLAKGVVHYANPFAAQMFPDLQSQGLRHPLLAGVQEAARALLDGKTEAVRREIEVGEFSYLQTLNYIPETQRLRLYGSDITASKRAEEELRRSQARFATVFRSGPVAMSINIVADGRLIDVNERYCGLFGYSREEIIGRSVLDLNLWANPEDRAPVMQRLLKEGTIRGIEAKQRRRTGEVRDVLASLALIELDGESDPVLISMFTDITERKRTETQLRDSEKRFRELNATLEQRVFDRTAELSQAKTSLEAEIIERKRYEQSLQKANRIKSQFLAHMSHELRTPLNGIIGFAEFLVDGKPGLLNPKQKEYLNDILNSGRHLLQLINDVLDLSKVEAGKMELNLETFLLPKAIDEVCAVANPIAQKKNIQVHAILAPDLSQVTLDQQKFKQVLYNLLSNAVKFTDEGGQVEIVTATRDARHFQLLVKDSGIGIKPEDIHRLFTEFEQLDSGASRRHEGTGLGLALTRKIVELHGGSIDVESEPGQGSTFTVTLPMAAKEAAL